MKIARLKIALITPGFSADENDWCIPVLYNLVRELAKEHEIHVFTLRYPHRMGVYPFHGATVHAFGGATRAGVARFPLLFQAYTAILTEGRRVPFDLLHAFWGDEPGFLAGVAGGRLQIPRVVSLMGGELVGLREIGYGGQLSVINRALTEYARRRATRMTAGSRSFGNIAKAYMSEKPIQVLPLGVDTTLFRPTDRAAPQLFSQDTIHLLHVASLVPVKDQITLFRAFARVIQTPSNPHLHILGDGPLRPRLEQLAQELDISSRITFHGSVSHHETPRFYQSADLSVLSSRFESQGMVVLEAAACGVTTIGTAVGILPEIAPTEQVVPVGDVEALAGALTSALSDPTRTREIGRGHVDQIRERYSLARYVHDLGQVYTSVLKK